MKYIVIAVLILIVAGAVATFLRQTSDPAAQPPANHPSERRQGWNQS